MHRHPLMIPTASAASGEMPGDVVLQERGSVTQAMTSTRICVRHYLLSVSPKRDWRRQRSRVKRKQRRVHLSCIRDPDTGQMPRTIIAPQIFTITDPVARKQLLMFIEKVKSVLTAERRPVYIDFSQTCRMVTDGTLLFYAEIDKLVRKDKNRWSGRRRMIRCSYPKDPIVEQVLQQVGIFEAVGKTGRASIEHDTVKHWRGFTGVRLPVEEQAELMQESYQRSAGSELLTTYLNVGIQEAIINCVRHAYEYPQPDPLSKSAYVHPEPRWWMFTQVKDGMLSVALCDLGIGIPASLRNAEGDQSNEEWKFSIIQAFLEKWGKDESDAELIQAAFAIGRSKTKKPNRGKGLAEIKKVLEEAGKGNLQIYSGTGYYRFDPVTGEEKTRNYLNSAAGTLILWTIPELDG